MEDISFSVLQLDDYLIKSLEIMRVDAYNINNSFNLSSFYKHCLRVGNYVAFGVFCKKKLVGACYVSKAYNSLYIEQLFIMKKFQNTELHLGSSLLKYVLSQKEYIESYFNTNFKYSYLDNATSDNHIYEKIGYRKTKSSLMRKPLDKNALNNND